MWVAEKAMSKAELEWRKAIPLMEELKLKPQLQNFRAWLWASATVSALMSTSVNACKPQKVACLSINAGLPSYPPLVDQCFHFVF